MKFIETKIPQVLLIEPRVFEDKRGFFLECYSKEAFERQGISTEFVQDNHSASAKGVLRGLHYQMGPDPQAKLVRVIRGEVFDVVVDIRKGSKTFGRYVSHVLSAKNKKIVYVPAGFAHGFLALENWTELHYKTSSPYRPQYEGGIIWNDPTVGIRWPKIKGKFIFSDKDQKNPTLEEFSRL